MIRPATTADIPAILAIWNPIIRDTMITFNSMQKSLEDMEKILTEKARDGHAFLLAERDGAIVGFATYGQFRAGVGYAQTMEHSIVLTEAARGFGLGRQLLTALEDHARTGGAHSMFAGVSSGNPAGRTFHAAMGYVEIATLPAVGFKFDQSWDLVLMQKFLT